jgi:hypothetical protein
VTEGGGAVSLAAAGRAEQEQVGALVEPTVAGGERVQMRLAEHGHSAEVEAVEGLAGRQMGLGEVTFDAPSQAFGEFELGEGGEEPGGGPALAVGPIGELRPQAGHGRQPQLCEQERQAGGVDTDRAFAGHRAGHGCASEGASSAS